MNPIDVYVLHLLTESEKCIHDDYLNDMKIDNVTEYKELIKELIKIALDKDMHTEAESLKNLMSGFDNNNPEIDYQLNEKCINNRQLEFYKKTILNVMKYKKSSITPTSFNDRITQVTKKM